jgi:hypothetical protein
MKKTTCFLKATALIIALLSVFQKAHADPIINFFLYPYPYPEKIAQKLKNPGKIARQTINGILRHNFVAGIFSTYAGYIDITDINGQTFYPRKYNAPLLHLVITEKIIPVTRFNNTIDHWEIIPGTHAAFFKMEKKQDMQTGLFFWDVHPEEKPANNIIPLDSLTLIADPEAIYVPIGITITDDTANFLLPPLYVKKQLDITHNALYMLHISHLFSPSRILFTKEEKRYIIQEDLTKASF